jgi:HTH-type transcriptional regulator/antitoxin HipB
VDYPLKTPQQLSAHLKSLRQAKGLTQAELGKLVGVQQARVARIERDPGAVKLEQLLQILQRLGAQLTVQVDETAPGSTTGATLTPTEDW